MRRYLSLCLLVAGIAVASARAQMPTVQPAGAYYRFADDADRTMQVKVWGAVSNPGLYEVREGLSLSTVLSLAGGPLPSQQVRSTSKTFRVSLYRLQQNRYQLFTETLMEDQLTVLAQDPVLVEGDMVFTEEQVRQRFGWRDGLSVLTAIATVVLVIDNVVSN